MGRDTHLKLQTRLLSNFSAHNRAAIGSLQSWMCDLHTYLVYVRTRLGTRSASDSNDGHWQWALLACKGKGCQLVQPVQCLFHCGAGGSYIRYMYGYVVGPAGG